MEKKQIMKEHNIMKTIGVTILFLFCLILSTPFTTSMLYDDLRVYYSYENDALDSSINANNGVLTDGSYVAGKVGQAIELNALGEWFEIAETDGLYNFTDEVTICTWAKVADHLQYFIYTTNIGANTVMSLGLNVPSNKIGAYDGSSWLAGTGQNVNDAWTHVCWLFKDTTFTSYVDGVLAGTDGGYRGWLDMLGEIGISGSANQYLTGEVDETAIWNRSLSENEIEALYNGGDGCAYENLTNCQLARDNIAYYRFQTDADDDIGGYDGVLEGTPTQTTGIIGYAYNYDGGASDDAIKISTSLASGEPQWSYSVWVKQETLVTTESRRILYGYARWNAQSHNSDGLAYYVDADSGKTADEGSQNSDLNNWIHIIGVYDGVEIKLYVNNVLEDTIALTGNVDTGGTTGICIGGQCDSITPNAYWIGDIDELSFWNRSLNVDEIDFLYAGGSPTVQQQYPYNSNAPIDYFEITAYDPLYQSYHQVFNATLCDSVTLECTITQWNTTTGTLTTSYEINYTKGTFAIDVFSATGDLYPFNITGGYDINASGNLLVNLTNQSATTGNDYNYTITINITDALTGATVPNFTTTITKSPYSLTQTRINASGIVKYGVTGGDWELLVDATLNSTHYSYHTQTISVSSDLLINVSLFPIQSLNISVYDEITDTLITGKNLSFEFISTDKAINLTVTNGQTIVTNLSIGEVIIRYAVDGYQPRVYYVINLEERTTQQINLYLLNSSVGSNVSVQTFDQSDNYLVNVYIKSLRYYIACNCFQTVELVKTNFEGATNLFMELNDPFYKLIIQPNATATYYVTDQYIPDTTSLSFIVPIGLIDPLETQKLISGVSYTFSFNNNTNNFDLTFNDGSGSLTEACIEVNRVTIRDVYVVNSSCLQTTAGSEFSLGVEAVNGSTYQATLTFDFGSGAEFVEVITGNYFLGKEVFGNQGIFLAIMFLIIISFSAVWNPNVSIILFTFGLIATSVTGLISIGTGALTGIVGVAIIIMIMNKA